MKFDFEKSRFSIKKAIVGLLAFVLIAGQSGITSMADWVDVDGDESYSEGDISGNAYVDWEKREKKAMPGDSCTFEVSQEDIVLEKYVKDEEGWADWEKFSDEDWENVELQYQWYKINWDEETEEEIYEKISGATEASYTIYDIKAEDFQGEFECEISVKYGTDESQTAIVDRSHFWLVPDIGFEGVDEDNECYKKIYTQNKSGVLNVDAKCTNEKATLEYKWYVDGEEISGATSNSCEFKIEDGSYSKSYECVVKATVDGVSRRCYYWFDIYRYDNMGKFAENSIMNVSLPGGARYGYTFTPSQTDEYFFYSISEKSDTGVYPDPYANLIDSDGNPVKILKGDTDDANALDFKFKVALEANKTYTLLLKAFNSVDVTFAVKNDTGESDFSVTSSYKTIYTQDKTGTLSANIKCTNENANFEYQWYEYVYHEDTGIEGLEKIEGATSKAYEYSFSDGEYNKYVKCDVKVTVNGISESTTGEFNVYRYENKGTFSEDSSMEITAPQGTSDGRPVCYGYTFTPSQTAEYTFSSTSNNISLEAAVLNSKGNNVIGNDFDYESWNDTWDDEDWDDEDWDDEDWDDEDWEEGDWDDDFQLKSVLVANKTYTFVVCIWNGNTENTFTVTNTMGDTVECPHADTSLIDAKEATYFEEGYTGDIYCNDCETIIEKGQVIAKKECAHTNTSVVDKKTATCLKEGYTGDTYCNDCETVIKKGEKIAKIPATISLNVKGTIPLKVKQSTTAVRVSYGPGDGIASWKSSNTKIATVSSKGKITGKKAGTAKITVVLKSGKSKSFNVKVQKKEVATTKVTVNSKNVVLKKGGKFTVKTTLAPITSVQKVKYTSSNKKVATVSSKGVITAKKKGTAKITVTSGKKKVTIKVTVK
ncbi:MAG: Ig-like domain-containing protein [Lachnospiraceae bacterium]